MKKTLTTLIGSASAILATAISAVPTTAHRRCVGCAVGAGEQPADAPRLCVPMGNRCRDPTTRSAASASRPCCRNRHRPACAHAPLLAHKCSNPVGIISTVSQEHCSRLQARQERGGKSVVVDLACCERQPDWQAVARLLHESCWSANDRGAGAKTCNEGREPRGSSVRSAAIENFEG
jgi:hypothetical protein